MTLVLVSTALLTSLEFLISSTADFCFVFDANLKPITGLFIYLPQRRMPKCVFFTNIVELHVLYAMRNYVIQKNAFCGLLIPTDYAS